MFYRKTLYSKIEKTHHRPLKVFYGIDGSQINPEFMWLFFKPKRLPYNLKKGPTLNLPRTYSIYYGTNAIYFRGSLICNCSNFKFKTKIQNLENIGCGCLISR